MEPKDIKIFDKNIMTVFEQIKADIFQTRGKVLADANKELLSMYFRRQNDCRQYKIRKQLCQ